MRAISGVSRQVTALFLHAQRYFVCYRRPIMRHAEFLIFRRNMPPVEEKRQFIIRYKAGLRRRLLKPNVIMRQYFSISIKTCLRNLRVKISSTPDSHPHNCVRAIAFSNPTFHFYPEMLDAHVPTMAVALLRGEPLNVPATALSKIVGINSATLKLIRNQQLRSGAH